MYIDDNLQYKVIEKTTNEVFQALWLIILLTAFWTIMKKVLTTIAPPVNQS